MPPTNFADDVHPVSLEADPTPTRFRWSASILRYGEARGEYDKVVATLNALDPHGN